MVVIVVPDYVAKLCGTVLSMEVRSVRFGVPWDMEVINTLYPIPRTNWFRE